MTAANEDEFEERFKSELELLNRGEFETSLIVLDSKMDFQSFYHMTQDLEEMLESAGLENHFQLVAFHPEFCFEGLDPSDKANLVNRSPWPLLHILRFSDIEELSLSPQEAEQISHRNEKKLKEMKESDLHKLFLGRFG